MASNLPPGCTNAMIDALSEDRPCEVCGYYPDDCICPECPKCGKVGNPECYPFHGLTHTLKQQLGLAKLELAVLKDKVVDQGMYIDWLESEIVQQEEGKA